MLEAESPFSSVFEQGQTSLIEQPEELEDQFVEEHEFAWERGEFPADEAYDEMARSEQEVSIQELYDDAEEAWNELDEEVVFPLEEADYADEEPSVDEESLIDTEEEEAEWTSIESEHIATESYFDEKTDIINHEASAFSPLSQEQQNWMLSLERSAIERLPDAEQRQRFLEQVDWSRVEFPGNGPDTLEVRTNWKLADELFNAMAIVTPERRVPQLIKYHNVDGVVEDVPDQRGQKLFPEARDTFVRMHDAAKADGVQLTIISSWRSLERQEAARRRQSNPLAVARGVSAHTYGLAIDLRMSVAGLHVQEANTRTPEKMANVVRMYRSPVYKWMSLRGRGFGWYPYRREPWHWEYNPPGFKERFEGTASESMPAASGATILTHPSQPGTTKPPVELVRFAQRVLNATEGERLAADGIPGPRTTSAFERFRRKYNLGAGGVLDDITQLALAQRALEELARQSMFEKGKRDAATNQAISEFKTQRGLGVESTLDAATRASLADALERRVGPPSTSPAEAVSNWAQVDPSQRMRYVVGLLVKNHQYPENGAAGIVGNLWVESGVLPNRIEGSSESAPMRAPDFTGKMTEFTAEQVMNRNRSAQQGPRRPGIGLAQWSSPSRRAGLFNHTFQGRKLGANILYDMDAQVDYLVTELQTQYRQVNTLLRRADVLLEEASDEVVYTYEVPGSILGSPDPEGRRPKLPRNHPSVIEVFQRRRSFSRNALRAYQQPTPS